jgi:hypothetical protein
MLFDAAKRYPFLDRNGNRLNLDRKTGVRDVGSGTESIDIITALE